MCKAWRALILYQSPPKKYTWKSFQGFYKILNPTCHLTLIWWGILLYWFFAQLFKSGMQGRRRDCRETISTTKSFWRQLDNNNKQHMHVHFEISNSACHLRLIKSKWPGKVYSCHAILSTVQALPIRNAARRRKILQQDRYFTRLFVLDKPKMACWIGKFMKGACIMHSWCCHVTFKVLLWDDFCWRQREIAERNHHLHNNTLPKPYWSSVEHTASKEKEKEGILWKEMMLGNGGRWRERRSMCYWPFT